MVQGVIPITSLSVSCRERTGWAFAVPARKFTSFTIGFLMVPLSSVRRTGRPLAGS